MSQKGITQVHSEDLHRLLTQDEADLVCRMIAVFRERLAKSIDMLLGDGTFPRMVVDLEEQRVKAELLLDKLTQQEDT